MSNPVRVLMAEGSSLERLTLTRVLEADGRIQVVGSVSTLQEAVRAAAQHRPQVITMDLELIGAETRVSVGIRAIAEIMQARAVPILVLSSPTRGHVDRVGVESLAAGAADIFTRPDRWSERDADQLRRRVLVLSRIQMMTRHQAVPCPQEASSPSAGAVLGIVASTGGPAALLSVVSRLAGVAAPVLVVQHIHASFAESFAGWLADGTGMPVQLAAEGVSLAPGTVYLAPPHVHLLLGEQRRAVLDPEPADALNRPSGDVLLASIARQAGAAGIGCVLTGMGNDGAEGLALIRAVGGLTFAQDGDSAVVDGMPRAARENGAAQRVLPPEGLGHALAEAVRG
jgi:two-component system chemotaxis response regulator CheB